MKVPKEQTLYIRSMGKALKVTAIFYDEDKQALTNAVNEYSSRSHDEGLVSLFGNMAFMANIYDLGVSIK